MLLKFKDFLGLAFKYLLLVDLDFVFVVFELLHIHVAPLYRLLVIILVEVHVLDQPLIVKYFYFFKFRIITKVHVLKVFPLEPLFHFFVDVRVKGDVLEINRCCCRNLNPL